VRWSVQGKRFSETFDTTSLAESFRARLLTAARGGESFDTETGLPQSIARALNTITWYELAVMFCDMKWKGWAPGSRAAAAEALATVTAALVSGRTAPPLRTMRRALETWAFNKTARESGGPCDEYSAALGWIRENSIKLAELTNATTARLALDAIGAKLDGTPVAATTANRKRMVFHQALEYGVERAYLDCNPLDRVKWKAPKTTDSVDRRVVVNATQARTLLLAVSVKDDRFTAFFALIYYAALRPAEVADLRITDCELPESGWGMLYLARSMPNSGAAWTNSGKPQESQSLKHRAKEEVRPVPAHPELVAILLKHIEAHGTAPDGRLIRGAAGGRVPESAYGRVWRSARQAALEPRQAASPLAKRPYDLRHAAVSTWLNAGVPPTLVAEWAGHSVQVLLRVYAKCIDGQEQRARDQIDEALKEPETNEDQGPDTDA
jgi:integrase